MTLQDKLNKKYKEREKRTKKCGVILQKVRQIRRGKGKLIYALNGTKKGQFIKRATIQTQEDVIKNYNPKMWDIRGVPR